MKSANRNIHTLALIERYAKAWVILWTIFVAASLIWNLIRIKDETLVSAKNQAEISLDKDILYRKWNSMHGGVYVPITEETQPNPYLAHIPERDITSSSGKRLTLMNPAYMTRQVHSLMRTDLNIPGHITSLKPLSPMNAPDPWEVNALRSFEQGVKVASSISNIEGKEYYRLMKPFITEKLCLKCHANQGYRVGDIRGGISVSILMKPFRLVENSHLLTASIVHILFWIGGLFGILMSRYRIRQGELARIEINRKLQKEKDKVQKYIDIAAVILVVIDPKQNVTLINKRGCEILGYDEEEIIGKNWFDNFIPRNEREKTRKEFDHLISEKTYPVEYFENAVLTKSGAVRLIAWRNTVLNDDKDNLVGTLSSGEDITERKKAEEAIKQSERYFRLLIENALDIITILDADETIRYESPSIENVLGYTRQELIGKNFFELVHTDDLQDVINIFTHLTQNPGGTLFTQLRYQHKNGTWKILEIMVNNLLNDPTVAGIVVNSRDITERKDQERMLRETQDRFKTLFENSPIPIWEEDFSEVKLRFDELRSSGVTDFKSYLENNKNEVSNLASLVRIIDINQTSVRFFGVSSKEEIIRNLNKYFTEDSMKVFTEEVISLAEGNMSFQCEIPIKDLYGRDRLLSLYLIVAPGFETTLSRVLISFLDITESRKAEGELKRIKEELERSNADLQQFAYAASHDLQAPIRNVEGFTKLLAKRYGDKLDNKASELIGFIIEGVKNMQNLITDILEYSQVESKGREFKVVDISNPLALAIANLQKDIEENNVEITYDKLPDVMGDSAQLTRLFQNLIENAIKFKGKQSPKVHISVKPGENEWVFSVADNGIGIDSKDIERIFAVFHQLHGKSEYPGTGIGLALCKKIVERHKGLIWVESEPEKGSIFYFTMPFMKEDA